MHCKLSGDIYSHILYSVNILYGIYFSKLVGTTADDAALIELSLSELNEADGGQQSDSENAGGGQPDDDAAAGGSMEHSGQTQDKDTGLKGRVNNRDLTNDKATTPKKAPKKKKKTVKVIK